MSFLVAIISGLKAIPALAKFAHLLDQRLQDYLKARKESKAYEQLQKDKQSIRDTINKANANDPDRNGS